MGYVYISLYDHQLEIPNALLRLSSFICLLATNTNWQFQKGYD